MRRGKRGWIAVLLLLVAVNLAYAIDGCYYEPGSADYCQKIADTQAADPDYFSPGKDCAEIPECRQVICTATCTQTTLGECTASEGKEIDEVEEFYDDWCSPGCCKTGTFCSYLNTKFECVDRAMKQGLPEGSISWTTIFTDSSMTPSKCQIQVCQITVQPSNLQGYVLDAQGQPITAQLELDTFKITSSPDGSYKFSDLQPQTYQLKVSAAGYSTQTQSLSLQANETRLLNITLTPEGVEVALSGIVMDSTGPLQGATVSLQGPTTKIVSTDTSGSYSFTGLSSGTYTVTVSRLGYTMITETISITAAQTENFILQKAQVQGVKGYVYIDLNGDGQMQENETVSGASIYIDGAFKGYSQYQPLGYFEISLSAGKYSLDATYQDYQLKEKIELVVQLNQQATQNLLLVKYIGECSHGQPNQDKAVQVFTANHVPGEQKVLLNWKKPCPEVTGYKITRTTDGKTWTRSPADFFLEDKEVEWGKTYSYQITAVYSDVVLRESQPVSASIAMGDEICEGRYDQLTGWKQFCSVEKNERKQIWSCTDENRRAVSKDCSSLDTAGQSYYCAEVGNSATCKDGGKCGLLAQLADPFGLYYNRETCYGVKDPVKEDPKNFCYYDHTTSIVDKCSSCVDIDSCFSYQSKEACEINNCLGKECRWINATQGLNIYSGFENILFWPILKETGQGYCTEKDYSQDDQCRLCGPGADLFENYYCTADVCAGLGRCFSRYDLTRCLSCGSRPTADNNCYAYGTELECTGGQPLKNIFGEIILSEDSCGWGRCVWRGGSKFSSNCVKDGDGDGKSDCDSFQAGEKLLCMIDNKAPETKLVPEGIKIISHGMPNLTFSAADEESSLGVLGYCLDSSQAAKCNRFKQISYPGKSMNESLTLDLISTALKDKVIKGETYRLRYYSKDKYFNQENIREEFIFVDTELPQFEINTVEETRADTTDLTVFLTGLNEPMGCVFSLQPVLPSGSIINKTADRQSKEKNASFTGLSGVIYNLTVTCTDDYANSNSKSEQLVFDLEQGIDIKYPKGAVAETRISFKAETAVGAVCGLYLTATNTKAADFTGDETNKIHQTPVLTGFVEGIYAGTYKIICQDLLTQQLMEDYFNFRVDFSGPKTQIILKEGIREAKPSGYGWEENFVERAEVSFACIADGFQCNFTRYCLGDGCEYRAAPGYMDYSTSFTISNTTEICYYSLDSGGNAGAVTCGKIVVDGLGITLINPQQYYYLGEKWGVSSTPTFDLVLTTKVPTQECRFDFIRNFNYDQLEPYKRLKKDGDLYSFTQFPGEIIPPYSEKGGVKIIYVACRDLDGKLGPVEKINLEYDPTAPKILEAYAEPDPVLEGIETSLYVNTDDKTICRYDEGTAEFSTMKYSFPGEDEDQLNINHIGLFKINFLGARKEYNLSTQCINGAGDLSQVEKFSFTVDYSALGNIISTSPSGYIRETAVVLTVVTNKNAYCTYDGIPFPDTGATQHTQEMSGLAEGEHIYLVNCLIEGENRQAQIKFTIDLTAPIVKNIEDGNYSCSLSETPSIFVYTDEENIAGYYYEMYGQDNESFATVMITNGTLGSTMPFRIKTELIEGSTYYFKIGAGDAAGNWGEPATSDGFMAVPANYSACLEDAEAPTVELVINESCTFTSAEMYCRDITGCAAFNYGQSSIETCEAIAGYSGQKIMFSQTGWLCYYAEDMMANNRTDTRKIEFKDEDGDGIADHCDLCPGTKAGAVVDAEGCAYGEGTEEQKLLDTDGDGLPDFWEKLYNRPGCPLDYLNPDSDENGILDPHEDYDGDGYTNYEEYKAGYDPCSSDAPAKVDDSEVEVIKFPEETIAEKKSKTLAWILFILGWLLLLGGSAYLIYYYKYSPRKPAAARSILREAAKPTAPAAAGPNIKERLVSLRKAMKEKEKSRERASVFGEFSRQSKEIPHLEEVMKKKAPSLQKLQDLAQKHVQVKEQVRPGLRPEEKGIFSKLENIARQTKEKKIGEVVSEKEADSIFDKLKKISKKRKGGE